MGRQREVLVSQSLHLWICLERKFPAERCIQHVSAIFWIICTNFNTVLRSLSIGQGCKICPFNDLPSVTQPYCRANRDELFQRVSLAQTKRLGGSSGDLQQQLLQKTLSLWSSFRQLGCQAPPFETTYLDKMEQERSERWNDQMDRKRRGHEPKKTCDGRLVFEYDNRGKAFVR